jgi:flagellar basal body-associated protein FliL
MKTNANNSHNAVFSSPLPILIILLVIILAIAGKLSAGQNSTDGNNEPDPKLRAMAEGTSDFNQDTDEGRYDRYYQTLISDPVDGREKLVELRYSKDGRLTEILIDDRALTRAERRKNEKIISRAVAEERKVEKEIDEMVEGIGSAVEETMQVISDVFVTVFEDLSDGNDDEADSHGEERPHEARKRDRKARLSTLEELESGQGK